MTLAELPQSLVAQFRSVSLERLERIEDGWSAITQRMATPDAEAEMFRDVHTLKGEARLVGFADVVLITQRFEDLLFAARRRRYRVHEDVDVAVTMAIQFIRMLLRKRAGASQGGIDLNGFLSHIDEILTEWPRLSDPPDSMSTPSSLRGLDAGKVSAVVRQRIGAAAANVFLESLAAPGRTRLRRAWESLVSELAQLEAVALMPLIRRHAVAAKDLAVELGKEVDVVIEGPDVRVSAEVLDTIHASLLHTLRNAVDHGIEPPAAREAAKKPRRGTVLIRVSSFEDVLQVVVEDDGAGADVERIRGRARELGLLTEEHAAAATEATLLDLVFAPGFTVRETATTVSGRGIGMDAVRSAIERIRGTISMTSRRGAGATVTMRLPQTQKLLDVHIVPSTRRGIRVAIPTTWTVRRGAEAAGVDPLAALGVRADEGDVEARELLMVARDGEQHVISVGGPPENAAAVRICPTPPDEGFEVVEIDGEPVLLLRPDVLFGVT